MSEGAVPEDEQMLSKKYLSLFVISYLGASHASH